MVRGFRFTHFVSASPVSMTGMLNDYDCVMIADMPSRICQRIHSGVLAVE
jgi:hypothetical protein